MTEKLNSIMDSMSNAVMADNPSEMVDSIDEELEELKQMPNISDDEIDEILADLWVQSEELNCKLDKKTAEPIEAYDCESLAKSIRTFLKQIDENDDDGEYR